MDDPLWFGSANYAMDQSAVGLIEVGLFGNNILNVLTEFLGRRRVSANEGLRIHSTKCCRRRMMADHHNVCLGSS